MLSGSAHSRGATGFSLAAIAAVCMYPGLTFAFHCKNCLIKPCFEGVNHLGLSGVCGWVWCGEGATLCGRTRSCNCCSFTPQHSLAPDPRSVGLARFPGGAHNSLTARVLRQQQGTMTPPAMVGMGKLRMLHGDSGHHGRKMKDDDSSELQFSMAEGSQGPAPFNVLYVATPRIPALEKPWWRNMCSAWTELGEMVKPITRLGLPHTTVLDKCKFYE